MSSKTPSAPKSVSNSSPRRTAANRANAQKSTGPKSPEVKGLLPERLSPLRLLRRSPPPLLEDALFSASFAKASSSDSAPWTPSNSASPMTSSPPPGAFADSRPPTACSTPWKKSSATPSSTSTTGKSINSRKNSTPAKSPSMTMTKSPSTPTSTSAASTSQNTSPPASSSPISSSPETTTPNITPAEAVPPSSDSWPPSTASRGMLLRATTELRALQKDRRENPQTQTCPFIDQNFDPTAIPRKKRSPALLKTSTIRNLDDADASQEEDLTPADSPPNTLAVSRTNDAPNLPNPEMHPTCARSAPPHTTCPICRTKPVAKMAVQPPCQWSMIRRQLPALGSGRKRTAEAHPTLSYLALSASPAPLVRSR